MKLNELGAQRPTEQISRVIESRLGSRVNFSKLNPDQARTLLVKINRLISEHRGQHAFYASEHDANYLKLIMMQQGLKQRIVEQSATTTTTPGSSVLQDPEVRNTVNRAIGKSIRNQTLTPDEQKAVSAVALLKKENRTNKRMVKESELQQAQVVLAAQDMIDRVQGMIEDISEMQFKDLPALTDSIKNDMGTEQANQFQTSASAALAQLLESMQQGKTQLETAQGVLTGQEPVVPGQEDFGAPMPATDGSVDLDIATEPEVEPEEEDDVEVSLGRERR